MKARNKILIALGLSAVIANTIVITGCSDDDFQGFNISPLSFLRAAVFENCEPGTNFEGTDIYGDLITDPVVGDYWQLGAHPATAIAELPDLGLDIFTAEIETGTYEITNGFIEGKAFIYYIDSDGNEYNSTANNGNVSAVFSPGSFSRIEVTFNNVEVYNAMLDETMCINNFSYSFAY